MSFQGQSHICAPVTDWPFVRRHDKVIDLKNQQNRLQEGFKSGFWFVGRFQIFSNSDRVGKSGVFCEPVRKEGFGKQEFFVGRFEEIEKKVGYFEQLKTLPIILGMNKKNLNGF